MTIADDLAELDAGWDQISPDPPRSLGAFGHVSDRRLGLRVPTACWALLKDGERSVYARTVELTPTGAVLKLLDGAEIRFDNPRRFELDVFVPGASAPIHAIARPARAIGQLEAFEFLTMSESDRLTLAEHLDRVTGCRPSSLVSEDAPKAPPVFWKNFVLSLK
jgi:hypothetical protein